MVLTAVYGLLDFPALLRMWRVSRLDFYAAAIALGAVLLLGILHGILLRHWLRCCCCSPVSRPHVAFLGRVPGTNSYSDTSRHPENEPLSGAIAFRPEASLIYVNVESVLNAVLDKLNAADPRSVHTMVCDLSAAPYLDLAGSRMLHDLHGELASRSIALRIVGAHGSTRDLLRADGVDAKVGGLNRALTLRRFCFWSFPNRPKQRLAFTQSRYSNPRLHGG